MNFEQMMQEIENFRQKQQADMDAFVNGVRESVKAAQAKPQAEQRRKQKNDLRYVYVTARTDGTFAIRFQSKYGQRYLRYGYEDRDKAMKDAKYLDDSLDTFASAIRGNR